MPALDPVYEEHIIELQDRFVWEIPEYDRHERGPKWYMASTVVALVLVGYSIWTANYLFAFIVLISAIILILAGNEHPEAVLVQIGDNGIVFHGDFISFDKIHNFAIVYQPPDIRVLYIEPKTLRPRLRIPLGDQDPVAIRNHLRQYISEDLEQKDEHASDILAKVFKL